VYVRGVSVVLQQQTAVRATPAEVFAFLHDPDRRQDWDAMVDRCRLEGDPPAVGSRVHLHGRRKAPSWVGEYTEFDSPRRSVVRLVEGVGMPFSSFTQTITVKRHDATTTVVALRVEYAARGPVGLVERFTLRPRLAGAVRRSMAKLSERFG
jgi:carbon monoxide dehydrogenase subunit G